MFTDIYAIKDISIHAPREGSDSFLLMPMLSLLSVFLSTLPARGATLPATWF